MGNTVIGTASHTVQGCIFFYASIIYLTFCRIYSISHRNPYADNIFSDLIGKSSVKFSEIEFFLLTFPSVCGIMFFARLRMLDSSEGWTPMVASICSALILFVIVSFSRAFLLMQKSPFKIAYYDINIKYPASHMKTVCGISIYINIYSSVVSSGIERSRSAMMLFSVFAL